MATPITVAQALNYEQDPSQIPAGAVFYISDTAQNIELLTASEISGLKSIGVNAITATDNVVTFAPGGDQQTALDASGLHITAEISASTAVALDIHAAATGTPILVPENEHVVVLDTAANLEAMTPAQLQALNTTVDTSTATGADSGKSAVTQIAATDTPAAFSSDQVAAIAGAKVVIASPPHDAAQNDGTVTITGRGMTFVITWDSSVASAPAAFKTDIEEVFQFYANTYGSATGSPVTLYYDVGYGEFDNTRMSSDDLGENEYFGSVGETYANVLSHLGADATSPAQLAALSTLPATDPTTNQYIGFSPAEAQIFGFANAPTSSAANPDGYLGFSDDTDWNYNADPNQTPVANAYDFIATVEHEISEVMGRASSMGDDFSNQEEATGDYSLMDLYRYSAPGTPALSPFTDPSYFSIDNGVTNLGDWNNFTSGNDGDLGDWAGTTVNGTVKHTADAFNDNSDPGIINPFTPSDATLMNVLGYDFTSAPSSPLPLPSTDITLSAGQLLEYITLNEISPGSVNAPAGDSYVVIDTAFDIESITADEFTQALALGVSEFIVDGAIADLRSGQITALSGTQFDAVLTVSQAFTEEAALPTVPAGETVIVADTAANIEALTPTQLIDLRAISTSHIVVSDLDGVGPLTLQDGYDYTVTGAVSSGESITFATAGITLTFDDTAAMAGTIYGFDSSEKIRLKDVAYDANGSVNLVGGNVLDVTENGTTYALQLNPSQNFSGDFFHLAADPHGGTDISENTTPCYCRGTRIRTQRGEKRVEKLKIGDKVMTRSGVARPIKWIGRRSFAGRFIRGRTDILPVCIKAGAIGGNAPRRDLWISPHHAMYFDRTYFERAYFDRNHFAAAGRGEGSAFDGVLIEAKDLINGASIVQAEHVNKVEYFHVELETHDVIIAEGALSETFVDDDCRAMFHNAHEFHALYPQAHATATHYYAPRCDEGFEVAGVRRRIALRAGLVPSADPRRPALLGGAVEEISPRRITGWAMNADTPDVPVCLDVYAGGRLIGQTLANLYHKKLAGLGSGHYAFSFAVPAGLKFARATIEVRRSADGRPLPRLLRRRAVA